MINNGVNVNTKKETEREAVPPLYIALSRGEMQLALLLIKKGADINAKLKDNNSILHEILKKESDPRSPKMKREAAKILINHGAKLNTKNKEGQIPLHLAAARGYLDIVSLLIKKGAVLMPRIMISEHLFTLQHSREILKQSLSSLRRELI